MEDFHGGLEFAVYKLFLLIDDRQTDGRTLLNVKSLSQLKMRNCNFLVDNPTF